MEEEESIGWSWWTGNSNATLLDIWVIDRLFPSKLNSLTYRAIYARLINMIQIDNLIFLTKNNKKGLRGILRLMENKEQRNKKKKKWENEKREIEKLKKKQRTKKEIKKSFFTIFKTV